jgi:hypothetical protein
VDDFLTGVYALRWHIWAVCVVITIGTLTHLIFNRPYDPRKGVRRGRERGNRGPDAQ